MSERHFIPAIDGPRALAALIVLLHHVYLFFILDRFIPGSTRFNNHSYLMVDCFLTISGFVIAHSFDGRMAQGMSAMRFLKLRVVRLYPMITVGVALGTVTLLAWRHTAQEISLARISEAVAAGLMLAPTTALADAKAYAFPVNSPHWSLSMEMVLYALYAVSFPYLSRRTLTIALVLSAALLILTAFWSGGLDIGYRLGEYGPAFGRVLFPFLVGIAMRRSALFRPRTLRWGYLAVPMLLLVAVNPLPCGWLYDAAADLIIMPAVVLLAANCRPNARFDRWATTAGHLSYPIYAIHFPIVVALANAAKLAALGPVATLALALLSVVGVFVAAWLLLDHYDLPMRQALMAWLGGESPRLKNEAAAET